MLSSVALKGACMKQVDLYSALLATHASVEDFLLSIGVILVTSRQHNGIHRVILPVQNKWVCSVPGAVTVQMLAAQVLPILTDKSESSLLWKAWLIQAKALCLCTCSAQRMFRS